MIFNPTLCQCAKCDTILRSKWEGDFVGCECGESFVDQTIYYSKYGGHATPLVDLLRKDFVSLCFEELLQEFLDENPEME